MKANEIRAELLRRDIQVQDIAKQLGIARPSVSQVMANVRQTPHIRKAIADAIGRPVSEVWPEQEKAS